MGGNLGWKFYKGLYRNLSVDDPQIDKEILKSLESKFFSSNETLSNDFIAPYGFKIKVAYPGLLIGIGYSHGIPNSDDDIKNGFYFDFTSGYPVIPGSSIKGVIRSFFPDYEKKDRYKKEKEEFIKNLIKELFNKDVDVKRLFYEIFEGMAENEPINIYKRDKFLDANIANAPGKIMTLDYITPHEEFDDPTPIRMLKVKPEVEFSFNFILHDGILSAKEKEELFFNILKFSGLGAKTNSGYGHISDDKLRDSSDERKERIKAIKKKKEDEIKKQKQKEKLKNLPLEERIFNEYKNNLPELIANIENITKKENADIVKLAKLIKAELQKIPANWEKAKQKKLKRKQKIQKILGEI